MIIYNKIIPFKGYKAINLFSIIFVKKGCIFSDIDLNHEKIHTAQIKELLFIGFYIWYLVEWLCLLIKHRNVHEAYMNIRFEKEAYANLYNLEYLKNRSYFSFLKY